MPENGHDPAAEQNWNVKDADPLEEGEAERVRESASEQVADASGQPAAEPQKPHDTHPNR